MSAQLQTAVVGATGYAGLELVQLLARHPKVKTPLLFTREGESQGSVDLAEVFPQVSGNGSLPLEPFAWSKLHARGVDLLFLATPHELSREFTPQAAQRGIRVVDLSGAWRLKEKSNREIYKFSDKDKKAAAKVTQAAVYGLTELHRREVAQAQIVANPGCYATSVILALAPLVRAEVVDLKHGIICDSKSGVSGAGKAPSAKTHFVEVADNLSAYSVFNHRHTAEILEQLDISAEQIVFTPHLLPIPRGILSTIYLRLRKKMTATEVENVLRSFYHGSAWVRIFPASKLPQIQFCLRTNFCDIGLVLDDEGKRGVVVSCLDNLMKGAAGQAVQNMNVMYGWNEKEGLN